MGRFLDPNYEHEGYVGLVADSRGAEFAAGDELEQRYLAGTYDGTLDAVQPACSCGWRGPAVSTPKGVHWFPRMVETPDDETLDELLAPWETHVRDGEVLDRIVTARRAERQAVVALEDAVSAARDRGVSWAGIGARLGVSRQAAWERFGRSADETPDE